jgi:polysaccharide export outer membrane protein
MRQKRLLQIGLAAWACFLAAGAVGQDTDSAPQLGTSAKSQSESLPQSATTPSDTLQGLSAKPHAELGGLTATPPQYILRRGDVIQVKVYQEEDLTSVSRIGKDGTITMPLLGSVKVVSNTLEQATILVRDLLAKDYLVDPQVTLLVTEYAKRRFTVLGQVQRPGTYDMPADEGVSLLQALATAGGYTRIANAHKITIQRNVGGENKAFHIDAEAMTVKKQAKPFEILHDDVIVVGEKWL